MPLAIYTSAAWTANGGLSPASQALVTVRSESTGGLASLFEDRDGNSGLDNPFNADSQGRFEFYVTGGAYRIEVESDGFTQELRHQAVGTAAEFDAGALSDHQSPEDKELLTRLDHLESALGIDTEGPAGADVLAAVGRGAIVESDTNANGSYVRFESGLQICLADNLDVDTGSQSTQTLGEWPADFSGRCWQTLNTESASQSRDIFLGDWANYSDPFVVSGRNASTTESGTSGLFYAMGVGPWK